METDYSRSANKWLTYPLFSIPSLILIAIMASIASRIPALSRVADFIFIIYLLILWFLPTIFVFFSIPGFIFSFKALHNQEPKYKVLGNLMISGIYLSAGCYFTYHFTYQIWISMM